MAAEAEKSSFRDSESTVAYVDTRVVRTLRGQAAHDWERLQASGLLDRLVGASKVVGTRVADPELAAGLDGASETVLEHERVPFVSYPFEWSFGMLRDAALLHLDLLEEALARGMTLKDGHAYNLQWWGTRPTFIDVSSFTQATTGPWPGYRQFCETFLNPLFLQAYRGVNFQPWLRGSLPGIPVGEMRRLVTVRDLGRRGVLKHVVLHDLLQRAATGGAQATSRSLSDAGFGAEVARATCQRLRRLVSGLGWAPRRTTWTSYGTEHGYSEGDRARKAAFVEGAVRAARPGLVWDLGANDGTFSRVAARHAGYVVALDADHATVERLWRSLRSEPRRNILPLVFDLTDPSPSLGWRGWERRSLPERGLPDLVLCLALVHHLAIGANVPLDEVVAWLADMSPRLVVEFVARDDPMVQRLLSDKPIEHEGYSTAGFDEAAMKHFRVEARQEVGSGTRVLYSLARR